MVMFWATEGDADTWPSLDIGNNWCVYTVLMLTPMRIMAMQQKGWELLPVEKT